MKWYKQDGNSDANPKIRRSGFWGARVFEALCRISADFELNGEIPAHYADPGYLADRIMAYQVLGPDEAEKAIEAALSRLAVEDPTWALLERHDDGSVTILGWRGEGKDTDALTSTERSRNFRELQRARQRIEELEQAVGGQAKGPGEGGNGPAAGRNEPATDATPATKATERNESATDATDATNATLDKSRRDKKRSDPPPIVPPPGEGGSSQVATKSKSVRRRKPRPPSPDVDAVRAEVAELVGIEYPEHTWDQLRQRFREGLSRGDALAYVRWAGGRRWERDEVKLDPTVLFRAERCAVGVAKATAAPRPGHGGVGPDPGDEPTLGDMRRFLCRSCNYAVPHRFGPEGWTVGGEDHAPGCREGAAAGWDGVDLQAFATREPFAGAEAVV